MVLSNKTSGRMVVLSIILAVAAVSTAWAEPISTDRPDFVESSRTVGEGRLQFEMSVAGEHDKTDGIKTTTFTTPVLIRYGIAPRWELRLEGDGYTRQETHDSVLSTRDTESGVSETSIGVKWHTHDGGGAAPSIGWLLHADIESGSRAFRGYGARPSLRAVFEWELPNGFSTGIMPGVLLDRTETGDHYTAGIIAGVLGKSWSDRFRTFVEVAGQHIASSRHGGSTVTYAFGTAYLLTDDLQIDSAVNRGATEDTPDWAWTLGLSVRF